MFDFMAPQGQLGPDLRRASAWDPLVEAQSPVNHPRVGLIVDGHTTEIPTPKMFLMHGVL